MPLNAQEAKLELSTAWKYWAKQKLSNAGQALNIAQQFKSDVGNNPKDASTHDINVNEIVGWVEGRNRNRKNQPNLEIKRESNPTGRNDT